MAELLESAVLRVDDAFYVMDGEILEGCQPPGPGSWGEETSPLGQDWLDVGSSSITLWGSPSGEGRYIRFELWDGPPAASPWLRCWEGDLLLTSGKVHVVPFSNIEFPPLLFDVGRREETWRVRMRTKLVENDREPDFPSDIYRVDLYVMQVWSPTGSLTSFGQVSRVSG